jgi:hypothetical protein
MKRSIHLTAAAALALTAAFATEASAGLVEVKDGYVIEAGNKYEIQGTVLGSCYTDNLFFTYMISALKPGVRQVPKFAHVGGVLKVLGPSVPYTCGDATLHHANCPAGTKWFFVERPIGDQFALFCMGGEAIAVSH